MTYRITVFDIDGNIKTVREFLMKKSGLLHSVSMGSVENIAVRGVDTTHSLRGCVNEIYRDRWKENRGSQLC